MLVTIDIRSCYPSMSHEQIFAMFRRYFGFGDEVSSLLTRLTTFKRHLPQGGATSPAIANALLAELVDRPLIELAAKHGVVYTRYIDDLAFSGEDPRPMIYEAASRLSKLGLKIDRGRKLQIATSDGRQKVTGLLVNARGAASVGRRYLAKVRSAIHRFPKLPKAAQVTAAESIKGRIVYVRRTNPGAAARLAKQFEAV